MRNITTKMAVAILLCSSLIASYPYSIGTVQGAAPAIHTKLSTPLSIENKGTIELKTLFAVPTQQGQVVAFTFDVINNSKEMLDFSQYWLRLHSKSGSKYSIRMVTEDSKNRIFPGQKQTYVFYSILPKATKMSDLQLHLIRWDSSVSNFERELGQIPIYSEVIPTLGRSVSKFIGLTNNQLEARVELGEATIDDQEESKQVTVNYKLKLLNKGDQTFILPSYQYILVTDSGVSYPLSPILSDKEGDVSQVLPWLDTEIKLSGVVPRTIDLNKVTLYVLYSNSDDKGNVYIPVTLFKTFEKMAEEPPVVEETKIVPLGTEVDLTFNGEKKKGKYNAKLVIDHVQRFPWDQRDILSAKLKLENNGDQNLSIPQLTGSILLDNLYELKLDVVLSTLDQEQIKPGESIEYQLNGYIPYNKKFKEAKLIVNEKSEGNDYKTLIKSKLPQYTFLDSQTKLDQLDMKGSYVIGDNGDQSSISIGEVDTYPSTNGMIIAARVSVKNLEKRGIEVPALRGFFRNSEGILYTANVGEYASANLPNGDSVVSFWAEFPKDVKQEDMELFIGDQMSDKSFKSGVVFALPPANNTVVNKFDNINFYPFVTHFSDFKLVIEDKLSYYQTFAKMPVEFSFNYKNERSFTTKSNLKDRNLIFEITNEKGEVLTSETVKFEGNDSWKDGSRSIFIPEEQTSVGDNTFIVSLYDEYMGMRKLLAKQQFSAFVIN